ncbi:MAG: hypothetical protein U0790_09070 [Isosphaeraceae bacterium]
MQPEPNGAHYYMAGIYTGTTDGANNLTPLGPYPLGSALARAQVIAWYDFIKSELPDVFFVQNTTGPYPLNFAANLFPGTPIDANSLGGWILPLGNSVAGPLPAGYGAGNLSNTSGTGIFGASYNAAAGFYKNLGYLPAGYDGVDNNGNGAIDEWAEGVNEPPSYSSANAAVVTQVTANLSAHQHNTARAEALYAVLVEGVGPLGSVFNRDDFTDREVRDTDGDGLPEFVDAWGQPLQFFRWPILHHSQAQKGQRIIDDLSSGLPTFAPPYDSVFEAREQSPLDPNQQLMAPAWWSGNTAANSNSPFASLGGPAAALGASGGVLAFEHFFHRLTEPLTHDTAASLYYWDRGATFPYRRAFQLRPLIVSSGPDKLPGVYLLPQPAINTANLLAVENNALGFVPDSGSPYTVAAGTTIPLDNLAYDLGALTSAALREAAKDDISNQNTTAGVGTGGP